MLEAIRIPVENASVPQGDVLRVQGYSGKLVALVANVMQQKGNDKLTIHETHQFGEYVIAGEINTLQDIIASPGIQVLFQALTYEEQTLVSSTASTRRLADALRLSRAATYHARNAELARRSGNTEKKQQAERQKGISNLKVRNILRTTGISGEGLEEQLRNYIGDVVRDHLRLDDIPEENPRAKSL